MFACLIIISAAADLILAKTGTVASGTDAGLVLVFATGFLIACALASSLSFLAVLGRRLLLLALLSGAASAGAIVAGWGTAEMLAKLIFAISAGLWIGLMLTSIGQVLLISGLIIIVDFYSVFLGPTKKIIESGSNWINYLTINLPVFGEPAISRLGISDMIFFSLFIASTLTYRLRRTITVLAMTASFIGTMVAGVLLGRGVPALPLLSVSFILSNADLLYQRFLEEKNMGGRKEM